MQHFGVATGESGVHALVNAATLAEVRNLKHQKRKTSGLAATQNILHKAVGSTNCTRNATVPTVATGDGHDYKDYDAGAQTIVTDDVGAQIVVTDDAGAQIVRLEVAPKGARQPKGVSPNSLTKADGLTNNTTKDGWNEVVRSSSRQGNSPVVENMQQQLTFLVGRHNVSKAIITQNSFDALTHKEDVGVNLPTLGDDNV